MGVLVVLSTIYKQTFHMKGPCLKMGRAHNLAGSAGNHPALLHACWLSDSCAQSFHEIGTENNHRRVEGLDSRLFFMFFFQNDTFSNLYFYRSHPNSQIQQLFLTNQLLHQTLTVASLSIFFLRNRGLEGFEKSSENPLARKVGKFHFHHKHGIATHSRYKSLLFGLPLASHFFRTSFFFWHLAISFNDSVWAQRLDVLRSHID